MTADTQDRRDPHLPGRAIDGTFITAGLAMWVLPRAAAFAAVKS